MIGIKGISKIVKVILQEKPYTRNSDNQLYVEVIKQIKPNMLRMPLEEALMHEHEIPNYETIRRARQRLQECFPELREDDQISAWRRMRQEEMKEYARSIEL